MRSTVFVSTWSRSKSSRRQTLTRSEFTSSKTRRASARLTWTRTTSSLCLTRTTCLASSRCPSSTSVKPWRSSESRIQKIYCTSVTRNSWRTSTSIRSPLYLFCRRNITDLAIATNQSNEIIHQRSETLKRDLKLYIRVIWAFNSIKQVALWIFVRNLVNNWVKY